MIVEKPWARAIILVDMNAFFASIEQLDCPEWQGKPVAVTNGRVGSTIITCSYEARAWGIKTGMRLKATRALYPDLIQAPARPERYASVSADIMLALTAITPDVEVFSVDEAFLDVTGCQQLHGHPINIAHSVQRVVFEASNILCSVGLSGDKTTAKYAAKLNKPNGFTVILPWESEATLAPVPVTDLCGINKGIGGYLAQRGVTLCGQMKQLPMQELSRRFGNPGRRIWLMAQGKGPELVSTQISAPKSIGHGKVLPPKTNEADVILMYFLHMSEKVAARLRLYQLKSETFFVGMNTAQGWVKIHAKSPGLTDDGKTIYQLCKAFLKRVGSVVVYQVQVTALASTGQWQLDLFEQVDEKLAQKTR